jgi:hypothetical protein
MRRRRRRISWASLWYNEKIENSNGYLLFKIQKAMKMSG